MGCICTGDQIMPRYIYECFECGHVAEFQLKLSELDRAIACSKCKDDSTYMTRVPQPVRFKVPVGSCGNAKTGYSGMLADNPDYSPNTGFNQENLDD